MAGFILKSLVLSERALVDQLLRLVVKKHSKWCKAQILQKKKIPIMRKFIWAISPSNEYMEIDHKCSLNF